MIVDEGEGQSPEQFPNAFFSYDHLWAISGTAVASLSRNFHFDG
jgi:hypothetical protein